MLTIQFNHIANGKKIEKDSTYINFSNEAYQVSKLKYYISNIEIGNKNTNIFLIDAFANNQIQIPVTKDNFNTITFQLGVDSIYNCSGAQEGALDPLNDMFWAWNTGYVHFKLEGYSPSSTADLQRIEQHIGGYKGIFKTMRTVAIHLDTTINANQLVGKTITVNVNLDKYWQGETPMKISEHPVIVTQGKLASDVANNFSNLFSLKSIE